MCDINNILSQLFFGSLKKRVKEAAGNLLARRRCDERHTLAELLRARTEENLDESQRGRVTVDYADRLLQPPLRERSAH